METTEKIVEAYVRYVKGWATIPNLKCAGQKEIDLFAIDPVTDERWHIETSVSISSGFSKLTDEPFEVECARIIDGLEAVETWVRNGVTAPDNYSIPVGGGNFYPDMVAKMKDGRLLIVEPKGRVDEGDIEKEKVGLRFAQASEGKVLFAMVRQNDPLGRDAATQIGAALA